MLSNYFCGAPLESSSAFSKSEENFNPKQLTNIMFADDNFTESFTADVPMGVFQNVLNNIHSSFCWWIYKLLLKVISLKKKCRLSDFLKKQIETKRVWHIAVKKRITNTLTGCSQVFLIEKILENETTGEFPGWRPALHLL